MDQIRSRAGDGLLFRRMDLAAEGIGGFADQRLCADGAAVDAPHQPVLLHRLKIAANGLRGYAEPCDQLLHIDKARAAEQFLDTFPSYLLHSV